MICYKNEKKTDFRQPYEAPDAHAIAMRLRQQMMASSGNTTDLHYTDDSFDVED